MTPPRKPYVYRRPDGWYTAFDFGQVRFPTWRQALTAALMYAL